MYMITDKFSLRISMSLTSKFIGLPNLGFSEENFY